MRQRATVRRFWGRKNEEKQEGEEGGEAKE